MITGLVTLALGSNLAWHYPRPTALGHPVTPSALTEQAEVLQAAGIRCRPNSDWSDLLVESARLGDAQKALQDRTFANGNLEKMSTPPELLADLGRLPGVKEANVWLHEGHEAVVVLAMKHGVFANEPALIGQVVEKVGSFEPAIEAQNIKVLDQNGVDLTFVAPREAQGHWGALQLQSELQSVADATLGAPKRAIVSCRFMRTPDVRIHLQASLRLVHCDPQLQEGLTQSLTKRLQERADRLNAILKGREYWLAGGEIYRYLGEGTTRLNQTRLRLDRERGIQLDPLEVKEWTLRERSLGPQEIKMALWGLTPPVPTPWQLGSGLLALAPAIFGWSLLVPWLLSRHRLSRDS